MQSLVHNKKLINSPRRKVGVHVAEDANPHLAAGAIWQNVQVVCACLFAFALVMLPALSTLADDATDWPHPRGGLHGQGVANVELADAYKPAWSYKTAGPVMSSAVIVNGVVYVGSEDKKLHAIKLADGKKVWTFDAGTLIDASPVVDRGVVYVGTDGGAVFAINAITGELKWRFDTGGRVSGEAGVTDITGEDGGAQRVVIVGSHDGLLYCLRATDGKKIWEYETGDYINCGITLEGGTVVLGGCDTYLHLIELATGKKLGEVELGGEVAATPGLIDNHAYLGHMQSEVLAVSIKDQKVAWRFTDRSFPFVGAPAVTDDIVLIGSRGRRLYAIDRKTGEPRWDIRTRGGIEGAPVIAGSRAVFGSAGGLLSIIDLENKGKTVWQYDIGQGIDVSPAVTDTHLVVGSEDGVIYAFKASKNLKPD